MMGFLSLARKTKRVGTLYLFKRPPFHLTLMGESVSASIHTRVPSFSGSSP
jgi:hypothetical protein